MSAIKRYDPSECFVIGSRSKMEEDQLGDYVSYEDYVALRQQLEEAQEQYLVSVSAIGSLARALKQLSFAAQITGGVAGRDEALCAAISGAEEAMSLVGIGQAANEIMDLKERAEDAERRLAEAQGQEPVFWYRPADTGGGYEGPIHDRAMEQVRKDSGKWIPLYTHLAPASDERVKELAASKGGV